MSLQQAEINADRDLAANGLIRLLCADDHPLMRDGIAFSLRQELDMQLVGEVADGQQAIEAYRRLRPDVVLMDLQMPGTNGLDALIAIRREFPQAKIVVLSTFSGDMQTATALKHGACSYLLKDMVSSHLIETIRSVHAGRRVFPAEIATQVALHLQSELLSPREVDVVRAAAAGCSNKLIAQRLGLTEQTIKGYMKSIFAKLGANDRTHAVMIAMRRGFLGT